MPPSTPSHPPPNPSPSLPYLHLPPYTTTPLPPPPHRKLRLLRPSPRTNPAVWCTAVLCFIFSLLLILFGIVTLIIFLVIKPKLPLFETANASLNALYLDSPYSLNADLTLLANFSNPNHKMDVVFQYLSVELYFGERLIAVQALPRFALRRGESRLESVRMVTSEVYLSPPVAGQMEKQVRSSRVLYHIRGTFKVRATVGLARFTYWLYGRCQIELAGPPAGVLVARSCTTSR